ncbi:hypothetical protein BVX98_07460 [bacterium F11]|nr:hypothetical protein BVX98_07460 [bacterium F11]
MSQIWLVVIVFPGLVILTLFVFYREKRALLFIKLLYLIMLVPRLLMATLAVLLLSAPFNAGETSSPPAIEPTKSSVDYIHAFISQMYVRPLAWFDRFFLTKLEEAETNRSFLRVVSGYEWVNKEGFDYQTGIRAKVRLPTLKDRWSLFFFAEREDELAKTVITDQSDAALTEVPVEPGERDDQVAVRYLLLDWLNSRIDVDTGLRSKLRAQVSARFRQRIPITQRTLGRLTVKTFWLDQTGFGIRPQVALDQALSPVFGLRWINQATHIEQGPGMNWESRAALGARLSSKDSAVLTFTVLGPTKPMTVIQLYRTSVLYRRAFYRKWVFFEIEPGIQWERSDQGSYPPIPTAGVRLEVRFQED